jgi:hypothetical protein
MTSQLAPSWNIIKPNKAQIQAERLNRKVHHWIYEKINNLSIYDKAKIYTHYLITHLSVKHDFAVVDMTKQNCMIKWGAPYDTFKNLAFYKFSGKLNTMEFQHFIDKSNYEFVDLGHNWNDRGYAKRYQSNISGIYAWVYQNQDKYLNILLK